MSGKTNKVTALEKLHLQKIRLKSDADIFIRALDGHMDYLQNNLGGLLANTVMTAAQSKLPPFLQNLFPAIGIGSKSQGNQMQTSMPQHPKIGIVIDQVIELLPLFFKGAKPVIFAFLLKKAKNMIFGKKKHPDKN